MGLSAERAFAVAGAVLGVVFLLAMFKPMVVSFYIPSLSQWKYMRTVTFTSNVSSSIPYVVLLRLPSDSNFWAHVKPDLSDVRVTVGTGSGERILPSQPVSVNYSAHTGYLAVLMPRLEKRSYTLRLYYGNPNAEAPEKFIARAYGTTLMAFDASGASVAKDFVFLGNAGYASGRLYLSRGKTGVGVAVSRSFPLAVGRIYVYAYAPYYYSGAELFVGLTAASDSNGVSPLPLQNPAFGYLYDSRGRKESVVVFKSFEDVNTVYARGSRSVWVSRYITVNPDGRLRVNISSAAIPLSLRGDVSVVVAGRVTRSPNYYYVYRVYYQYTPLVASPVYSEELPTPEAPRIDVSFDEGQVISSREVSFSVTVSDPNDDLKKVSISLDGNVLRTLAGSSVEYDFSGSLPDGRHVLSVVAVDSEGLKSTSDVTFYVDTTPPQIKATYEYNLDVNAYVVTMSVLDDTLDHCYYTVGGKDANPVSFSCSADGNVTVSIPAPVGADVYVYAVDRAGFASFVHFKYTPPVQRSAAPSPSVQAEQPVKVEGKPAPRVASKVESPRAASVSVIKGYSVAIGGGIVALLVVLAAAAIL